MTGTWAQDFGVARHLGVGLLFFLIWCGKLVDSLVWWQAGWLTGMVASWLTHWYGGELVKDYIHDEYSYDRSRRRLRSRLSAHICLINTVRTGHRFNVPVVWT